MPKKQTQEKRGCTSASGAHRLKRKELGPAQTSTNTEMELWPVTHAPLKPKPLNWNARTTWSLPVPACQIEAGSPLAAYHQETSTLANP
ncbi:hypothetical protein PSHT_03715 [Puccinia striiformis]|uniref:Uncharacterized protein n=1 Tax=Puccinia striiformis TaxID=27350 RepID=A0A2S4WEP7_9BASI|nr:hypothetical protein PSHT_03715 [Puccinia striiformis]